MASVDGVERRLGPERIWQKWVQLKRQEIPLAEYWDENSSRRFRKESSQIWDREIAGVRLEWNSRFGGSESFDDMLLARRTQFDETREAKLQELQAKRFDRLLEDEHHEQWLEFRRQQIEKSSQRKERRKSAPRKVIHKRASEDPSANVKPTTDAAAATVDVQVQPSADPQDELILQLESALGAARLKLVEYQERYSAELQRNRELLLIQFGGS